MRASVASLGPAPRVLIIDDIDRAFPDAQTAGTRLVLTQSTYLMQRWIDRLAEGDRIIATADRGSRQGVGLASTVSQLTQHPELGVHRFLDRLGAEITKSE